MSYGLCPCASCKQRPENGRLTLIPLDENRIPLITGWIGDETANALAVEGSLTPTDPICLMICLLDRKQAVAFAEMLNSTFTELHVPYRLDSDVWSIRFFLHTSISLSFRLHLDIIAAYLKFLFQEKMAKGVIWEIHRSEIFFHSLAKETGFIITQQVGKFTLYSFPNEQS